MLQHFNTGNHVIISCDCGRDRSDAAERTNVWAHFANGMLGNIETQGVDTAVAQSLYQETLGASDIEHPSRVEVRKDAVGDFREEFQPVRMRAVVRHATTMRRV